MAGDVKFAVVNSTSPAGAGTQDFTSPGFGTPVGFRVTMVGVSSGDNAAHAFLGRGASDLTNTWAIGKSLEDGVANENTERRSSAASSRVIYIPNLAGGIWAECDYTSTVTDGVRLTWVTTPGAGYHVSVVLIGGEDAAVAVGSFITNADATEKTVTTNIDQKIVLFDSIAGSSVEIGPLVNATDSFGFSKATATRFHAGLQGNSPDAGAAGDPKGGFFNNSWGHLESDFRLQVTANDATSFGVTHVGTVQIGRYFFYLAIDTDDRGIWNDAGDTPTSTGDWARTGAGFTPGFIMGYMVGEATSAGVNTVGLQATDADGVACLSTFASDGINHFCMGTADEDAAATINANSVASQSKALIQYDDTLTTKHAEATVGFAFDEVKFNFTTAVAARYINYVAVEAPFSEIEKALNLDAAIAQQNLRNLNLNAAIEKQVIQNVGLDARISGLFPANPDQLDELAIRIPSRTKKFIVPAK